MAYQTSDFRNVVFLGHGGVGKTALAEAMLFNSGAIDRLGRTADGNTSLDYDPEEIKRQVSINMAVAPVKYLDKKINIIDTPGYFDFVGEKLEGLSVADSVLIVMYGNVVVGTEKSWRHANNHSLPRVIMMNKMNDENSDFLNSYAQIRDTFGKSCVAMQVPIRKDGRLVGYVDTPTKVAKSYNTDGAATEIPIPDDLKAVSYTHLDVYKRQVRTFPVSALKKPMKSERPWVSRKIHTAVSARVF